MPPEQLSIGERRFRRRLKEIRLEPDRSPYEITVGLRIDGVKIHKLPRTKKGQQLHWDQLCLPCDVSEQSTIIIKITEVHSFWTDRIGRAPCHAAQLLNQDEVSIGCENNMFKIQMRFFGEEEAKQAYLEAFKKVEQMQKQPGLPERSGGVGRAFEPLLDLGSLMTRVDPTGGAEVVFSVCTKAWECLEQPGNQDVELSELVKRLARMIPSVQLVEGIAGTNLKETLRDMLNLIEDVCLFILSARRRSRFERASLQAAGSLDVSGQSQTYIAKFEELSKEFNLRMGAQVLRVVEMESKHTKVEIKRAEIERMNARLRELKPADLAGYDPDRKCLAGTRISIISELTDWVQKSDSAPRLAWVHGLAGLGKSSIATSTCLQLDDQHILASSFFCKRDNPELRDPRRVFTIIYGLALHWDAYRDALVNVIVEDPELHSKHIQPLYDSLVTKPLQNLVGANRPTSALVVVIDALDECGDIASRRQLLGSLRNISGLESWLKLIVTSRPDPDIREFFERAGVDSCTKYNLLDYDAEADVRILIEGHLSKVTQIDDWPSDVADQLSRRANGLFIWAETACRFILDGFDQTGRLNQVLASAHANNSFTGLDMLYTTAITTSALDGADDNMKYIMKCLGVVIVTATRTPLSVSGLAQLLRGGIPHKVLSRVLDSLSSVLYEDRKQGNVVRLLHPSFMDYITDSLRSKELCIDLEQQNTILAECCLRIMNDCLKFNICGLETSHLLNSQVQDLDIRVRAAIGPHLSYSCLYWSSHVADAQIDALDDCLRPFLFQTPLMYWIEALSLLGKLKTALSSLLQFTGCSVPDYMQDCAVVVNDAYRFVLSFYDAISKSTPHLYISALAFAPSNSGIAQRMRPLFPKLLAVTQGAETEWTPCLRGIWVGIPVSSVAVSPNGHRVVSGSVDGTVRVWDAETGDIALGPLIVNPGVVCNCVAFSPDGRWIASGSSDKIIRVWNAETGEPKLDPLQGHSDYVVSIMFSPNGHRLVSGSWDRTARVWELETGQSVLELRGHSHWVQSVAFSPDSRWIASGSDDMTLRIWDAHTGESVLEPLRGHSDRVCSVAFSPDSHRIISGSNDHTIYIWNTKTGDMLLGPLQGHSGWVLSVAVSPDGRRIVSGSGDKTMRIWDAHTGDLVAQPLYHHSDRVTTVAFCPDGRLVSGSEDNTIRIWDVADGGEVESAIRSIHASTGHSGKVNSVTFSSDGHSVVSGSHDRTVRIWDAETGELVHEPLKGHTDAVMTVAVSSNGRWIASGSGDKTVRIWDVATGNATLQPLRGHFGAVLSVGFSPDSRLIVSGSDDKTVRIWDVETGQATLEPLRGNSWFVTSVAFSPDGRRIASAAKNGRVWDSSTGQVIVNAPATKLGSLHQTVAFSPDGRRIVFGSHGGSLTVLDAESGDIIPCSLQEHRGSAQSIAFSPDSRWIASTTWGRNIHIEDAQTGKLMFKPLQGHTGAPLSVAFSPDGRRLVSGSGDMSIRIWDTDPRTPSKVANPKHLPGSEVKILSLQGQGDRLLVSSNELVICIRPELAGWVTSATGGLLVWLPQEFRRVDDSLLCIPAPRIRLPVVIDFTEFVHGEAWSLNHDA
ncbi:hypothetical protein FRC12_006186 [Ceratobasidium sp. 428]|nr:hypothetical protein FRC12_006186 [Ceratobasidium sp. 428]